MSELKAETIVPQGTTITLQMYPKSEVDNVIAEKDAEIAELKEQVHDYGQGLYVMQARAEKELRHHNYKRCLAMAKWCEMGISYWDDEQEGGWEYKKLRHCIRWKKRWLELAEKFKEAK